MYRRRWAATEHQAARERERQQRRHGNEGNRPWPHLFTVYNYTLPRVRTHHIQAYCTVQVYTRYDQLYRYSIITLRVLSQIRDSHHTDYSAECPTPRHPTSPSGLSPTAPARHVRSAYCTSTSSAPHALRHRTDHRVRSIVPGL